MSASPRAMSRSINTTLLSGSEASEHARLTATLVQPTPPREPMTEMTWQACPFAGLGCPGMPGRPPDGIAAREQAAMGSAGIGRRVDNGDPKHGVHRGIKAENPKGAPGDWGRPLAPRVVAWSPDHPTAADRRSPGRPGDLRTAE